MENENLNPDNKTPEELDEIKRKKLESEEKDKSEHTTKEEIDEITHVSHNNDFSHTHPSHARHKGFGVDHEPGTL
ncbi:MAG: hypothetical protein ABI390_04520 [Daejeonella sp.]